MNIDNEKSQLIIIELEKLMKNNDWTIEEIKNSVTIYRKRTTAKNAAAKYYQKNKEEIIKKNSEKMKIDRVQNKLDNLENTKLELREKLQNLKI